jgi:DNA modification methylase
MKEGIYLDDCLDGMKLISDGTVDCVITDPPYGINFISNHRKYDSEVDSPIMNDENFDYDLISNVIKESHRILADNSHIYVFGSDGVIGNIKDIVSRYFTFKNILVWNKGNTGMGDLEGQFGKDCEFIVFAQKGRRLFKNGRPSALITVPRIDPNKLIHSCQKPKLLISYLIEVSTEANELICDPFLGSGTTALASRELGRRFIGFEKDERVYNLASKRLEEDSVQTRLF